MADDLKVADEEYHTVAYKIQKYGDFLSMACAHYTKIMQYISSEAIQDQALSQGITGIIEHVKPFESAIEQMTSEASEKLNSYLNSIDAKDSFLY